MLKQALKAVVPMPVLEQVHNTLVYGLPDLLDGLTGRRPEMVPPRRMIFTGAGDYISTGEVFLEHFKTLGGLAPVSNVLDVGSGIGRMARPLTAYLTPPSTYEGFDIDASGVRWCQENISSRFPAFRFQVVDLYNKRYNPGGKIQARDFRFPYDNDQFDFVFLTSVLTHMFPEDVSRYLSEIGRVLRPGGRAFVTCFLLNEESRALIAAGSSTPDFKFPVGDSLTSDKQVPESAIALDEATVLASHAKAGLASPTISRGSWCGRKTFVSYQDIIVSRKL